MQYMITMSTDKTSASKADKQEKVAEKPAVKAPKKISTKYPAAAK